MSDATKAVFLSYASQDAEAARRIADALRAAGVEVWFDADGGLEHGDEWDAKIRRQIKECVLFLPIISAETQAREEGYFRIEWDLAAERARGIASGVAFILPVVIDDTREPDALVPDRFRSVQWTKLPGGNVPPDVLQRFLKLWSHRTGALKHAETVGRDLRIPPESEAGFGDPTLQSKRPRWLAPVLGGLAVAVIALLVARPWQKAGSSLPAPSSLPGASAPQSEARQLTAKVWEQLNKPELARAQLETADGFGRRATELAPNDADAWAAWSQVDSWTVYHNFDASAARREAGRSKAARALQLAPDSYEARLAQACFLVRGQAGGDATLSLYANEAEKLLRALLQEKPDEPRALLASGILYRNTGRFPECRDAFNRMARNPAFAVQAWNELGWAEYFAGDYTAAGVAIDRSIALQGYWGNLALKQILAQWWLGDLDLAKAAQDHMPVAARQEDIGIYSAVELAYWRREPETMLQILDGVPRDWLQSNGFTGPTAWYAGLAHRMAGRAAAAQLQWRTALAVVERRLGAQSDSAFLIHWKGTLLAALGKRDEAEPVLKLADEMGAGRSGSSDDFVALVLMGNLDQAIDVLERRVDERRKSVSAAAFRLDPDLDPLREQPRFKALLARMEADPRFSPNAKPAPSAAAAPRDWPKDPELKRAFAIITGTDVTVESCRLAEDMVGAVLKQRPTDPEATVVYAMLNTYYINRGFDLSEERYVLARRFTERAQQLAPDEPEAMAAMAQFLTFRGSDLARAEELIRKAMALVPGEPRFPRILVYSVLRFTNPSAALAQAKADAARFPQDALTQYDLALICRGIGDLPLMEQAIDRTVALAPIGSALIWKGWIAAWLHGDLPGFKLWLDRISGNFRLNERAVYMRYNYACLSGDAAYGLEAVNSFPGSWMNDFYYIGPRSLLLADLLALQGKEDLAREEYERALAEIHRRAVLDPNDTTGERAEFWALVGLGRFDEAQPAAKRIMERLRRPYQPPMMLWWNDAIPAQLLAGARVDALTLIREAVAKPVLRVQIRTALRIDRRMAPFRDDPEIQALLAEPAAAK